MRNIGWWLLVFLLAAGASWLCGCSTSSGSSGNNVIISPNSVALQLGGSLTFTTNVPVQWSVKEQGGGTISQDGAYRAPGTSGIFHVIALNIDTGKRASATVLVSNDGGINTSLSAAPLADAVTQGFPDGGNLVRWPLLSNRVLAYLIYRDTNPLVPIAVRPGTFDYYIDSASPLSQYGSAMETTDVDITINPDTGDTSTFSLATKYTDPLSEMNNSEWNLQDQSFHVACRRVPLLPSDTSGYCIRVLYVEFDQGGLTDATPEHPDTYRLFLGNISDNTERVAMTEPPELLKPLPNVVPLDGGYRCRTVPGAMTYVLQISSQATFPAYATRTFDAYIMGSEVEADVELGDLYSYFPTAGGSTVYWRMGTRIDGHPTPVALTDTNQQGWVFSSFGYFTLPPDPPPPPE